MSEAANLDQRPHEPLLYTVEEAAELLRIGRTLACSLPGGQLAVTGDIRR